MGLFPPELGSIVGLAVLGVVGDLALKSFGKPTLAVIWDLIISMAGMVVGLNFLDKELSRISVFGVHIR